MPASDFTWSAQAQTPIFQVYGTKRKVSNDMAWGTTNTQEEQMDHMAKRKCVWNSANLQQQQQQLQQVQQQEQVVDSLPPSQIQVPMGLPDPTTMAEVNHNHLPGPPPVQDSPNVQIPPPLLFNNVPLDQQTQGAAADCSLMTDHFLPNCVPWPAPDFQQLHHQNDQIMNMDDETYSTHQVCETESAHQTMDSDCAPDPAQYNVNTNTSAMQPELSSSPPENRMGDDTLMSNRVRCFCKPSWEGVMYLRPYISDVY